MTAYLDWIRALARQSWERGAPELGTLSRVDADARIRGVQAVHSGEVISLSLPLVAGPSVRGDGRPAFEIERFYQREPVGVYTDAAIGTATDHVRLDAHGIDNTHIDALTHTTVDDLWYGGGSVDDESPAHLGALAAAGVVSRGIYLDLAASKGGAWVPTSDPVSADDLERALAASGQALQAGDVLLLDLGRDRFVAAGGGVRAAERPGIGESGARWIAEQPVGAVAWDFLDAKLASETPASVHLLNWAIGLVLIDNCDFSRARGALVRNANAALLMTAPLAIAEATGGNVNPLVMV
ncbi:cyclase family protein [Microbacterium sp. RD1]|uniref:cyclase family protein n=1 Tax=Microbacterium sp. RD1 TaxID=3457313 RepID=UPI003FA60781